MVRSWVGSRPPRAAFARWTCQGDPGDSVRLGSTRSNGKALSRSVAFLMPNCRSAVRVLLPARLRSVTEPATTAGSVPAAGMGPAAGVRPAAGAG